MTPPPVDPISPIVIILFVVVFVFVCIIIFLWLFMTSKDETIEQLKTKHDQLMRSFNELDEQAKLIVRTDLELNKAQAELDKRLNGLNALQRVSRQINQAMNEEELFQKISPTLFEELGFSRVLLATLYNSAFKTRLNVGFNETKNTEIIKAFASDETIKDILKERRAFSSLNSSRKVKERLLQIFESEYYVLVPIVGQSGVIGAIFVGNRLNAAPLTQADEELIAILASQIGQSLENALLFEKVFRASQELEIKVKDRTRQLASALTKVEEISKKKTEFISAVSHELRTPLTSIKGYAALLIAGKIGEVPDAVKERLSKINTHSDNLVSLINNLLDIARIESGRQEMKFASHDIKHVVENIKDLLTPQLSAKEIKLNLVIPEAITHIYIDTSQAERVFINLLSNAIKFTPKGGTITIEAAPQLEEGYATFNVTDTGIGIPEDDLKKLFSEFFRVDNEINQNVKGTGLGLVLAKNIVQAHRGRIWVKSQVNVGTSFYFTLPTTVEAFDAHKEITKESLQNA